MNPNKCENYSEFKFKLKGHKDHYTRLYFGLRTAVDRMSMQLMIAGAVDDDYWKGSKDSYQIMHSNLTKKLDRLVHRIASYCCGGDLEFYESLRNKWTKHDNLARLLVKEEWDQREQ